MFKIKAFLSVEGHYAHLLHAGDTKEADNPVDNINVGIKHNVTFNNYNCFTNKIHIQMFIKFITFFIGLLFIRNEQQYLVWFIFIKLLFILI